MIILPVLDAKVLKIAGTSQKDIVLAEEEGEGTGIDPMVSSHLINGWRSDVKDIESLTIGVEDVDKVSLYSESSYVPVGMMSYFVRDLYSLEGV